MQFAGSVGAPQWQKRARSFPSAIGYKEHRLVPGGRIRTRCGQELPLWLEGDSHGTTQGLRVSSTMGGVSENLAATVSEDLMIKRKDSHGHSYPDVTGKEKTTAVKPLFLEHEWGSRISSRANFIEALGRVHVRAHVCVCAHIHTWWMYVEGVLEPKDWFRLCNILVYGITKYFEKLLLGISKPLERKYSFSGLVLDPPVLDSSPPCRNFRVSSECQGAQHILTLLSRGQVLQPCSSGLYCPRGESWWRGQRWARPGQIPILPFSPLDERAVFIPTHPTP